MFSFMICLIASAQSTNDADINQLLKVKEKKIENKKDLVPHYLAIDALINKHKYEDKEWFFKVIEEAKKEKDSLVVESFVWSYYVLLHRQDRKQEALNLSLDLIEYAETNVFPISGDFYIEAGIKCIDIGDYVKALDFCFKAIDAYDRDKSENNIYVYGTIGTIYKQIGNWDEAFKYYKKGIHIAEGIKTKDIKYYNITHLKCEVAEILSLQGKTNEAKTYFENAINDAHKQSSVNYLINAYTQNINFYTSIEEYENVQPLISKTEFLIDSIDTKSKNYKLIRTFYNEYLLRKSEYGLAVNDFSLMTHPDSLFIGDNSEYLKELIYDYAILYFKKSSNYSEALKYSKKKTDQLKGTVDEQIQSTMNLVYEKQNSAKLLKENFELKDRTRQRNSILVFLSTIILFLGVLAVYILLNNRKMKQLQVDLECKNKEVRKQYEELESITYATTHDLKEPAHKINTFIKRISKNFTKEINEEGMFLFDLVEKTSNEQIQSITLLHNYLTIGQSSELTLVNLNKVLKKVISSYSTEIETSKTIKVLNELPTMQCYEIEMEHLFHNLISNAIKYSKKNIPTEIIVNCSNLDDCYQFEIQDNGIGINVKMQDRIFELFQRLFTASEFAGNGIGLASARKIVELHKGKIWVKSKLTIGSSFYFTISKNLNKF